MLPSGDARLELLSGTLEVFAGGCWKRLQRGESVRVPKATVHGFRNSTDTVARAINTHDPGLRILEYWEQIERLIRQGKLTGMSGLRNGVYLGLLATEFRREIVVVRPPDWFIRTLAQFGKTFGFTLT